MNGEISKHEEMHQAKAEGKRPGTLLRIVGGPTHKSHRLNTNDGDGRFMERPMAQQR